MGPVKVPLNARNFLIMVAKNAVNAALLSAVQIWHDPQDNNFHNWHGIKGVLWTIGSAVAAREAAILVPKVLKWSTTNDVNGGIMKSIIVLALLFGSALSLTAQTPPPTGAPFTVTGAYAASSGNTINNGIQSTFEYAVRGRWSIRIDDIMLANPSGTLINLGGGQWKIPANAIFGHNSPSSFSKILVGLHAGLGAVKAPGGGVSFGLGGGGSVDYQMSSIFFVRVLDVTDVYSRGLVPHNQILGNYNSVAIGAGVGFSF